MDAMSEGRCEGVRRKLPISPAAMVSGVMDSGDDGGEILAQ